MMFSRSALSVLIFLLYLHSAVSGAATDEKTVRAYLNDSAILPCSGSRCSGKLLWAKLQNSSYVVAWCDQSSCHPSEGFQIPDYGKGNYSLNITAVNPSNAGSYSCQCENTFNHQVLLQIINTSTVLVEFNGSAVLPCSTNCSGVVTWINTNYLILAECNKTSCRSVKEGYQMIYNQYLQGDLSLIITEADFSKIGWYTCECDGIDLCDDRLQIKPLTTQVQLKLGESLLLELGILDPVEVIYQEMGAVIQTRRQICTVDRRSPQFTPDYTQRTSLSNSLELRDMNITDSGVYTVRDTEIHEDIYIYNVTVKEEQHSDGDGKDWVPTWRFWLIVGLCTALFVTVVVLSAVIVCMCKNDERSCKERLELKKIRRQANEESSQNTEQEHLTSTDDSDN